MPTGILLVLLLLTVASPSQPTATDLEHQHLLLSGVSLSRAGFLGIGLNGALEFLITLPAVLLWSGLYYGNILGPTLFAPLLLLCCLMSSLSGLAAHAFSEMLIGRAIAAFLLCATPLLGAVSALVVYGDAYDVIRAFLTFSGTIVVTGSIYAGIAQAVFSGFGVKDSDR